MRRDEIMHRERQDYNNKDKTDEPAEVFVITIIIMQKMFTMSFGERCVYVDAFEYAHHF